MRSKWFFILLLFCVGCNDAVSLQDLDELNGYWEIDKVVFADGISKEYRISTTIDYVEYKDLKGFRKKVQPNLDGTFNTSDDAEYFEISSKNDKFIIRYKNNFSQWEEVIKSITHRDMIIVNQEGISYHYKRFETIAK